MASFRQEFMDALDSMNIKFTLLNEEDNLLHIGVMSNTGVKTDIFVDFDETKGGEELPSCKFIAPSLAVAPEEKTVNMLVALNELNRKFRFAKFSLSEENQVSVQIDIFFRGGDAVDECLFALQSIIRIVDESYPVIMRTIYA